MSNGFRGSVSSVLCSGILVSSKSFMYRYSMTRYVHSPQARKMIDEVLGKQAQAVPFPQGFAGGKGGHPSPQPGMQNKGARKGARIFMSCVILLNAVPCHSDFSPLDPT